MRSYKQRKNIIKQLENNYTPRAKQIPVLEELLIYSLEIGDDDLMAATLTLLSRCKNKRNIVATIIIAATLFRHWYGNIFDPKSWRRHVNSGLREIFELEELYIKLNSSGQKIYQNINKLLEDIFSDPITIVLPVLDSIYSEKMYYKPIAKILDLIVITLFGVFEGFSYENLFENITKIDNLIEAHLIYSSYDVIAPINEIKKLMITYLSTKR